MAPHAPRSRSNLLRVQDVRDAYRLIGECRDVGSDPALWLAHLSAGLLPLFGAAHVGSGEAWWQGKGLPIQPVLNFEVGPHPCTGARRMRELANTSDPMVHALRNRPGDHVTHTRRELVSDRVWYRSQAFDQYRQLARLDHRVISVVRVAADGASTAIILLRELGASDFSAREVERLRFLHAELGRLVRESLVSALEPGPDRLSPRLRQTLACLLQGDSEKQVAARLDLSPTTIHQYVTALYRHFGVHSRAQLLAHVLRRRSDPRWRRVAG
jgi:DNA-binding NarL/FixJ family response regulator